VNRQLPLHVLHRDVPNDSSTPYVLNTAAFVAYMATLPARRHAGFLQRLTRRISNQPALRANQGYIYQRGITT
jgi:hypothetical protein